MTADSAPRASTDSGDTSVELEGAFRHPAGLRTARYLVGALMLRAQRSSKSLQPSPTPKISPPGSGPVSSANSTIAALLKEILAFSDSPSHAADGNEVETREFTPYERERQYESIQYTTTSPTELSQSSFFNVAQPRSHTELAFGSKSSSDLANTLLPVVRPLPPTSNSQSLQNTSDAEVDSLSGDPIDINPSTRVELPFATELDSHLSRSPARASSYRLLELPNPTSSISANISAHANESVRLKLSSKAINSPGPSSEYQQDSHIFTMKQPTLGAQSLDSIEHVDAMDSDLVDVSPADNEVHIKSLSSNSHSSAGLINTLSTLDVDRSVNGSLSHVQPRRAPDLHSPNDSTNTKIEMLNENICPKKRKSRPDGNATAKRQRNDKISKPRRIPKLKAKKAEPAKYQLGQDLWMRILEYTPPSFLGKARLINKEFKNIVDQFDSIYVNCRKENFGYDMPPPPEGLTERQYSNLLGGKGCLGQGCDDKNASRTHWSWFKRWCWSCWKSKIEREDRIIKSRQNQYGRTIVTKMLECIPVGMHDSFMKPHDYVDDIELRPRGAPRLYKYYLAEDVEKIVAEFEALTPPPYREDPTHSPAEKSAALAAHQALMDALDEKRNEFFAAGKAKNDAHMAKVFKIEAGIRMRREINRNPYDDNRNARKELFARRAREDLPHIDEEFVKSTKAFKAATRIFRDGGTERGWLTLKPKIVKEYEDSKVRDDQTVAGGASLSQLDGACDTDQAGEDEYTGGLSHVGVNGNDSHPQNSCGRTYEPQLRRTQLPQLFQTRCDTASQLLGAFTASLPSRFHAPISSGMGYSSPMSSSLAQHTSFAPLVRRTSSLYDNVSYDSSPLLSCHRRAVGSSSLLANSLMSSTSSDYVSSYSYFHQPSSMYSNASTSAANDTSSTQISISSLLRPSTPAPGYHPFT